MTTAFPTVNFSATVLVEAGCSVSCNTCDTSIALLLHVAPHSFEVMASQLIALRANGVAR